MNREKVKELLPVLQAFAEGKAIQFQSIGMTGWMDERNPCFDAKGEWRIKPEPREFWITVVSGNGLKVEQISGAPFRSEPIGKIETGAFIKVREVLE